MCKAMQTFAFVYTTFLYIKKCNVCERKVTLHAQFAVMANVPTNAENKRRYILTKS